MVDHQIGVRLLTSIMIHPWTIKRVVNFNRPTIFDCKSPRFEIQEAAAVSDLC